MKVDVNFFENGVALKKFEGNKIYMADQTTFEIEFFNKDTKTVCPSIVMNGEKFRRSPVVYPGQRYRLKDFIDIDRKFLFTVYKVEDTDEVDEIIKKNGLVEITMYYEKQIPIESKILYSSIPETEDLPFDSDYSCDPMYIPDSKETGKIMKGEKSNMRYNTVNIELDYINTDYIEFKILPISYMPKDKHCLYCNTKYKEVAFNYCPKCGTKF